jgi:hypothetical protein
MPTSAQVKSRRLNLVHTESQLRSSKTNSTGFPMLSHRKTSTMLSSSTLTMILFICRSTGTLVHSI